MRHFSMSPLTPCCHPRHSYQGSQISLGIVKHQWLARDKLFIRVTLNMRSTLLSKILSVLTIKRGWYKETFGSDGCVLLPQLWWFHWCMRMRKLIELYELNIFSFCISIIFNKSAALKIANPSNSRCVKCPDWDKISSFCMSFHPRKWYQSEKLLVNTVQTSQQRAHSRHAISIELSVLCNAKRVVLTV